MFCVIMKLRSGPCSERKQFLDKRCGIKRNCWLDDDFGKLK